MTVEKKPETGNADPNAKPVTGAPVPAPTAGAEGAAASDTKADVKPGTPAAGDPNANANDGLNLDANDPDDAEVAATLKELDEKFPELSKRQRSALSKKVQREVEARKKLETASRDQSSVLERITKDPMVLSDFLKEKGFKLEKLDVAPDPIQVKMAEARQKLVAALGEDAANALLPVFQELADTVSAQKVAPLQSELEQTRLAKNGENIQNVFKAFITEIPDAANYLPQIQEYFAKYPGRPEDLQETLRNAYRVSSHEKRFSSELDKRVEEGITARIKQMNDAAAAAADTSTPSGSPDAKPVSKAKSGSMADHLREAMKEHGISSERLRQIQAEASS